jgi:hypothetical protein
MTQTAEQLPILSNADLKGYDRRRVALIREMEDHGWRGRRGTKHHIIMRAPDGVTTTAISPKVISPKNEHHVAADFRRWLRQQAERTEQSMAWPVADSTSVLVALTTLHHKPHPEVVVHAPLAAIEPEPEPVDTAPEPESEPVLPVAQHATGQACGLCEKPFATLQALSVHRVRVHSKVVCGVCDEPMSPSNLARHQRRHVEQLGTHEEVMREVLRLRAELADARAETTEWERIADEIEDRYTAVKGRLDNAVGYLLGDSAS